MNRLNLAYAAYVRDGFRPQGLVVVVVGNDFDESLAAYRHRPGLHSFRETPGGELFLERADYRPGRLRAVARRSALLRSLTLNGELLRSWMKRAEPRGAALASFGNTAADASGDRVVRSKRAVDRFLADLPAYSGLPSERVVFVVDGMRQAIYDPDLAEDAARSFFGVLRTYFLERARELGYEAIDLHPCLAESFERDGRRFEFPTDGHWNALGHGEAAKAVLACSLGQAALSGELAPVGAESAD